MWFFAPPSACTRLPLRVAVSYTWRATGVDPTNDTALTPGCASSASTATLSPCTTLNTPAGSPASAQSSAIQFAADGSFSLGLTITVLPGGDRDRKEPARNHRRKVERADDRDDAERLPDGVHVDARRDRFGVAALEQLRHTARELDHLEPARHFTERVAEHLAVLRRDDRRELLGAEVQELAEPEQHLHPFGQGGRAPRTERRVSRGHRRVDVGHRCERDVFGDESGGRVEHVARTSRRPVYRLPVDPMGNERERLCGHLPSFAG